jgi:hypothetical protein
MFAILMIIVRSDSRVRLRYCSACMNKTCDARVEQKPHGYDEEGGARGLTAGGNVAVPHLPGPRTLQVYWLFIFYWQFNHANLIHARTRMKVDEID